MEAEDPDLYPEMVGQDATNGHFFEELAELCIELCLVLYEVSNLFCGGSSVLGSQLLVLFG